MGRRAVCYDISNNTSTAFPFETREDIKILAVCPKGVLLLSIDTKGQSILCNMKRRVVLAYFNFHKAVIASSFSPDGAKIAVSLGRNVQIWNTPSSDHREFAPFDLVESFDLHKDDILHISWSPDSKCILTTSADMTAKITLLSSKKQISLVAHKHKVISGYFFKVDTEDCLGIVTLGMDSVAYFWTLNLRTGCLQDFKGKLGRMQLLFLTPIREEEKSAPLGHLTTVSFSWPNRLLCGFQNGSFALYSLLSNSELILMHALSLSQSSIASSAVCPTSEYLAFSTIADHRQPSNIVIWDWKTESFILRQQSHVGRFARPSMSSLALSSDIAVTGDIEGNVKIWNLQSGACLSTFSDHKADVCSLYLCKQSKVLLTASADGTLRAIDFVRFRSFKTMTTPSPVQFSCMTADASGEFVVAGTFDTNEIYVWSLQTGQIIDVLAGHVGPIQSLAFDANRQRLASASWDRSVRIWDLFARDKNPQIFTHDSEVLSIAFHPNGQEVAATTLSGNIYIWAIEEGVLLKTIEAHHDFWLKLAEGSTQLSKHAKIALTSCSYSPDGTALIVGGKAPFIAIYAVATKIILKRYLLTKNVAPREPQHSIVAKKGNVGLAKNVSPECIDVKFSPDGRSWAAITNEGLLIYSIQDTINFDPFDLDLECTPESIEECLDSNQWLRALVLGLRLSNIPLLSKTWISIPQEHIDVVIKQLPIKYLPQLLSFISSSMLNRQKAILLNEQPIWTECQRIVLWCDSLFRYHHVALKSINKETMQPLLRSIQRACQELKTDLGKIAQENMNLIDGILLNL